MQDSITRIISYDSTNKNSQAGEYRMDHAVTATQKEILRAFGMSASDIRRQAVSLNEDLKSCEQEGS